MGVVLVAVSVGCASWQPPPREPGGITRLSRDGTTEFLEVTARRDPAAIAALLSAPLEYGGMWFADATCRRQFATAGIIEAAHVTDFARCLAGTSFRISDRRSYIPEGALVTYDPGIELEIAFLRVDGAVKLGYLGYAGRTTLGDALPAVTQQALEEHRTDGPVALDDVARARVERELPADGPRAATTWLKVCIDAAGAVTGAHRRGTSSAVAEAAFMALVKQQTFRPFLLAGQATPVCALSRFAYPPHAGSAESLRVPHPIPPGIKSLVVADLGKRTAGALTVLPDDGAKEWIREKRLGMIRGSYFYCIDLAGRVDSVTVMLKSGVPRYDDQVVDKIKEWRFEPYRVEGAPTPACATAVFVYQQR